MSALAATLSNLCVDIARLTAARGASVLLDPAQVADRSDALTLATPGLRSANGSCRMVRAVDGWIAVNLPRDDDMPLVPAWLCVESPEDPWTTIVDHARRTPAARLVEQARLLGLPVARVGEVRADVPGADLHRFSAGGEPPERLRVLDMSALWAGPLCGAVLAAMGADVVKLESVTRPDPTRVSTPALDMRLNGLKEQIQLDLASAGGRRCLHDEVATADVLITSARPRAFQQLGLEPTALFARNPALVWVAISGYGWVGEASDRVAFGDDAAAAGGLVRWGQAGEPNFIGDAAADPLTGLSAAKSALHGLERGGGFLVDAALARCAAEAALMVK